MLLNNFYLKICEYANGIDIGEKIGVKYISVQYILYCIHNELAQVHYNSRRDNANICNLKIKKHFTNVNVDNNDNISCIYICNKY